MEQLIYRVPRRLQYISMQWHLWQYFTQWPVHKTEIKESVDGYSPSLSLSLYLASTQNQHTRRGRSDGKPTADVNFPRQSRFLGSTKSEIARSIWTEIKHRRPEFTRLPHTNGIRVCIKSSQFKTRVVHVLQVAPPINTLPFVLCSSFKVILSFYYLTHIIKMTKQNILTDNHMYYFLRVLIFAVN